MSPEINWLDSGRCRPLAFSDLRKLQGSSAVERGERCAVSSAFLNRGVATHRGPWIQFEQRVPFVWNIDDTGDLRGRSISRRVTLATDRRRSGFPISCTDTLSIVGIPQMFTHAGALIRSGSARTNARALAIVRKRAEKGRNSRTTPRSSVRGRGGILSYRGGDLKRTGEFTFTRYGPPFSAESSDSSRSRATLSLFTRFALGNRNRYTGCVPPVTEQWAHQRGINTFVSTDGTAPPPRRCENEPLPFAIRSDSRARKWQEHRGRGDKRTRRG